jgi:hypothetical protein
LASSPGRRLPRKSRCGHGADLALLGGSRTSPLAFDDLSVSRVLSLIVLAAAYISAWPMHSGFWLVTLACGPMYQIDSHTPGVLIAIRGWIVLLLFAAALFVARYASRDEVESPVRGAETHWDLEQVTRFAPI